MKNDRLKFKIVFPLKTKMIVIVSIATLVFLGLILSPINAIFWHKSGHDTQFEVKVGDGTRDIAKNLLKDKLISSDLAFSILVYSKNWLMQTGVYHIEKDMNTYAIAKLIHSGKVEEYTITVPEGWRATQIDELLVKKGLIKKGDFASIAEKKEGYLFPDTYRFAKDASAQKVLDLMLANFKRKTSTLKVTDQIVTMASIIEREALSNADRAQISSVYWNRLKIGMKFDADPTIQYGKGNWNPITRSDYKNFQSPYNTYLYNGLPPTAISNPGLKSIEAALNPAKTDYLFFFHKKNGEAIFSKTYDEHLANLEKYQ